MRTKRLLGAVAAASIATIAPLSATIASAADVTGVGTGRVSSTLLSVDIGTDGSVLSVRLLSDEGTATIDPANGAPASSTSITPLTISSDVGPGLNVTTPSVGTSSTGAEDAKTVSPDLPSAAAFSGELTASLSSVVDAVGARSGLDATLSNLSIAGGLLNVPSAVVTLGTNAATAQSTSSRSISIPSIEVLNLAAVLEGLGLTLADLPLDDLLGLLGSLGLELPDIPDPAAVVETVNDAIDTAQDRVGGTLADACAAVDGVLGTIGGLTGVTVIDEAADTINDSIGGGTPAVTPPAVPTVPTLSAQGISETCDTIGATVNDLINDLQDVVGSLVTSLLETLGDVSLLSVQGIEVGLVADAKSSVESSVAEVTGTIGSVKVGNLTVPGISGLDLTAAADVLNGAGDLVTAAVGDVLGIVNAQLANMVDVDVLQITEVVGADGDYANANAAVTALSATITPPALLAGAIELGDGASDVLDEVGAAVPALAPVMSQLGVALGGLDVLTDTSTITVGRLESSSAFRPVAAAVPGTPGTDGGTPSGELPRTGSDAAIPAMAAVLVAGVALGIRRFVAAITAS